MFRGYCRDFLAAFGWLTLAAASPDNSSSGHQAEANHGMGNAAQPTAPVAPPGIQPIPPQEYYLPCQQPYAERKSDLCAQWKAADSASDAALWSKWQFAVSALGLIGLLYSLKLTRTATRIAAEATADAEQSLAIAERNANAAAKLVEISERSSKVQLRAYVSIHKVLGTLQTDDGLYGRLILRNEGLTPAKITVVNRATWVGKVPTADPAQVGPAATKFYNVRPVLNSKCEETVYWHFDGASDVKRIHDDTLHTSIFVYGSVIYEDVFGDTHTTSYAYRNGGADITAADNFVPCTGGNSAD